MPPRSHLTGAPIPTVDRKREGEHAADWSPPASPAPIAMGSDLFCDGVVFDPETIAWVGRGPTRLIGTSRPSEGLAPGWRTPPIQTPPFVVHCTRFDQSKRAIGRAPKPAASRRGKALIVFNLLGGTALAKQVLSASWKGAGWRRSNGGAGHSRRRHAALIDRRANGGSSPDKGPAARIMRRDKRKKPPFWIPQFALSAKFGLSAKFSLFP